MAGYIANWALKLTANAQGLVQGLDAGAAKVKAFATQTTIAAKTMASGIDSSLKAVTGTAISSALGPLGGIGSALSGFLMMGAGPIGVAVALGAAFVGTATAVASFSRNSVEAVAESSRLANRIGVTAQEMMGLERVAESRGVSFDVLKAGLEGYAINLGKLQHELDSGRPGPIAGALASIGINAAEFARLPVAAQMGQLAVGLRGVTDGMQRLAITRAVLGRQGMGLENVLTADPRDLANLSQVAESSGRGISQEQAASARAAQIAFWQFGQTFTDIVASMRVAAATTFAPFAAFFTNTLSEAMRAVTPIIRAVGSVLLALFIVGPIGGTILILVGALKLLNPWLAAVGNAVGSVSRAFGIVVQALMPVASAFLSIFAVWAGSNSLLEALRSGIEGFGRVLANVLLGAAYLLLDFATTAMGIMERSVQAALLVAIAMDSASGGSGDTPFIRRLEATQLAMTNVGTAATLAQRRIQQAMVAANQAGAMNAPQVPAGQNAAWSQESQQLQQQLDMVGQSQQAQQLLRMIEEGRTTEQILQVSMMQEQLRLAQQNATYEQETTRMEEQLIRLQHEGAAEQEAALARHRGVSEELIRQRQAMSAQIEAAQALNRLRQNGEQLTQQMRNPAEVFQDRINELNELLSFNTISMETYERAVAAAGETLLQAAPQQQDRSPAAVLSGSVAEQTAILRAQQQDRQLSANPQERVVNALDAIRRQNENQQALMRDLVEAAQAGFIGRAD